MTSALAHRMDAAEIHRCLAGRWPAVLEQLGITPEYLTNKHGPCPACGGTNRYRFDNKQGHGNFYCNQCGAGDGFKLLQLVHRWTFAEARRAVIDAMGGQELPSMPYRAQTPPAPPEVAGPTARVLTLVRTSSAPDLVEDAIAYLRSRHLWPIPAVCAWRAHAGVDYYQPGHGKSVVHVGRFPALVGAVHDINGELVTAHVTYLRDGAKLTDHDPRKIFSSMTGRRGCAVRLLPITGEVLGIAEGIETALAASTLHDGMPVWAAINATLLGKFEPPPEVRRLIIFADRDVAGLEAAWHLRDSLSGRCAIELRTAPQSGNDWADELARKRT